jgi:hypothetical protein
MGMKIVHEEERSGTLLSVAANPNGEAFEVIVSGGGPGSTRFEIPDEVVLAHVAARVRMAKISALEQMEDLEVLGLEEPSPRSVEEGPDANRDTCITLSDLENGQPALFRVSEIASIRPGRRGAVVETCGSPNNPFLARETAVEVIAKVEVLAKISALEEMVEISEALLESRGAFIEAVESIVGECPVHGHGCLPHLEDAIRYQWGDAQRRATTCESRIDP